MNEVQGPRIRELCSPGDPLFGPLLDLYHRSFEPQFREPDERIVAELEGIYRIPFTYHVVEDEGRLAGFVRWTYLGRTNAYFIVHIAVDPAMRGRGYGSALVDKVVDEARHRPVLMEVENDVSPWWKRRGARILSASYTQPSLGPGLPSAPLLLMVIETVSWATQDTIVRFYREVWELDESDEMVKKALQGYIDAPEESRN